jgi:hypothetical protein
MSSLEPKPIARIPSRDNDNRVSIATTDEKSRIEKMLMQARKFLTWICFVFERDRAHRTCTVAFPMRARIGSEWPRGTCRAIALASCSPQMRASSARANRDARAVTSP